jgi:hypothetical protein
MTKELTTQQSNFIAYLRGNGCNLADGLDSNNISREVFDTWILDNTFLNSYNEAVKSCKDKVLSAIYVSALGGNTEAAKFYLENTKEIKRTALDPLGLDIMSIMNG